MKLIRVGDPGRERPGVLATDGTRRDTAAILADLGHGDYDEAFFAGDALAHLSDQDVDALPLLDADARLGPPIARPSKLVCIGLNFRDHAEETGATPPEEPVVFMKASSAFVGPNDDLLLPRGSVKTDWEVELAFVVGKVARYVEQADALDHVAGYVLHNDYSEREFQIERSGGQWDKGKGCDTFAPVGPFLATADELPPGATGLRMWLTVNGESRQESSTNQMIFGVAELLSHLSRFMTLLPGDLVSTGTPAGVAMGQEPPPYLRAGDVVALGIEGLGSSRQVVTA
jgi:2-keto-4-pentenoate hydratase/2-oxohepta-3-ene-1,7-dioic acid hydratase in catechol pathway